MKNFLYIGFLIYLGFIQIPIDTYACGKKSVKTELNKKGADKSNTHSLDCCEKEGKKQCEQQGKECNGNCGNPACHCPTNSINFLVTFNNSIFHYLPLLSKSNFYFQENHYSTGYFSIWLLPKIG
jgi:hypothetical protein